MQSRERAIRTSVFLAAGGSFVAFPFLHSSSQAVIGSGLFVWLLMAASAKRLIDGMLEDKTYHSYREAFSDAAATYKTTKGMMLAASLAALSFFLGGQQADAQKNIHEHQQHMNSLPELPADTMVPARALCKGKTEGAQIDLSEYIVQPGKITCPAPQ